MKTITTIAEVLELIAAHGDRLFVRWGNPNQDDLILGRSYNAVTGRREAGLSVSRWWSESEADLYKWIGEYQFLRINGPCQPYLLTGEVVGKGGDGEPVIASAKVVALIDDSMVKSLDEIEIIRLRAAISKDRERLQRMSDASARRITMEFIEAAESKLAHLLNK